MLIEDEHTFLFRVKLKHDTTNDEKVLYYNYKRATSGLYKTIFELVPDIHDIITRRINAGKTEETLGKSGILQFFWTLLLILIWSILK